MCIYIYIHFKANHPSWSSQFDTYPLRYWKYPSKTMLTLVGLDALRNKCSSALLSLMVQTESTKLPTHRIHGLPIKIRIYSSQKSEFVRIFMASLTCKPDWIQNCHCSENPREVPWNQLVKGLKMLDWFYVYLYIHLSSCDKKGYLTTCRKHGFKVHANVVSPFPWIFFHDLPMMVTGHLQPERAVSWRFSTCPGRSGKINKFWNKDWQILGQMYFICSMQNFDYMFHA